jgi:hypothetical protein
MARKAPSDETEHTQTPLHPTESGRRFPRPASIDLRQPKGLTASSTRAFALSHVRDAIYLHYASASCLSGHTLKLLSA